MELLDGKEVSNKIKDDLKSRIQTLIRKNSLQT